MSSSSSPAVAPQQEQRQQFFLPLTAPIVSNKVLQSRPLMNFLSLAPATSASYPRAPANRAHARAESIPEIPDAVAPAPVLPRRSSSVSSASSTTGGYRVLKLGPVHWGEHLGDHKDDFHD